MSQIQKPNPHIIKIAKKVNFEDKSSVATAIEEIKKMGDYGFNDVAYALSDFGVKRLFSEAEEQGLDYILYALREEDLRVVNNALYVLSFNISILPIDECQRIILEYPTDKASYTAANLLSNYGEVGHQILIDLYKDGNADVRKSTIIGVASYLRDIYQRDPLNAVQNALVDLVITSLGDSNPDIRVLAIRCLSDIKRIGISDFDLGLSDDEAIVRVSTMANLLGFGISEETARVFVHVFEDEDGAIVNQALTGISGNYNIDFQELGKATIEELIIRQPNSDSERFNPEITARVLLVACEKSPPQYNQILNRLCELAFTASNKIRFRAVSVARRINNVDFLALIRQKEVEFPEKAKEILSLLEKPSEKNTIIDGIKETDPRDIQSIAASQIKLINAYNEDALTQANTSFKWVIWLSIIGFLSLLLTIAYIFLSSQPEVLIGSIAVISSSIANILAATQLWIYNKATNQRGFFYSRIDQTQKILLANSVCELLEGEAKERSREELIRRIMDIASEKEVTEAHFNKN